jgi:hypothetical protein
VRKTWSLVSAAVVGSVDAMGCAGLTYIET